MLMEKVTVKRVTERVTGIEPALSAWELACHAVVDQHIAGQPLCLLVRDYPPSTRSGLYGGHATGTPAAAFSSRSKVTVRTASVAACLTWGTIVRRRPLASTAVSGDGYSLGYSVARESVS